MTYLKKKQFKQSIFLGIFLLTSCGFHLRGMMDMPRWLNNVSIIIQNAHHDLGSLLKEQLEAYHIQVCPNINEAKFWLIIEQDSERQQITSVSSSTTPRQYQLIYTVRFKLQEANGKDIMPPSTVVITRQLTVNSDRILGSNDEEDILKREMRQDAVIQILGRLPKVAIEPSNGLNPNGLKLSHRLAKT